MTTNLFVKIKTYCLHEIENICDKNGLIIIDCLKDENMLSVEEYNNGDLGDCIWEFKQVGAGLFELSYIDKICLKSFLKTRQQSDRF